MGPCLPYDLVEYSKAQYILRSNHLLISGGRSLEIPQKRSGVMPEQDPSLQTFEETAFSVRLTIPSC